MVPGFRVPGSRVPGFRVPGSRVPGFRVPGSRVSWVFLLFQVASYSYFLCMGVIYVLRFLIISRFFSYLIKSFRFSLTFAASSRIWIWNIKYFKFALKGTEFLPLNFLTPISLKPDAITLRYFKLRLFELTHFIVCNIKGLRDRVAKI